MIDVKKLIVGFLILAAVVSSSALILSGSSRSLIGQSSPVQLAAGANAQTGIVSNAFTGLTPTSADAQDVVSTDGTSVSSSDPNNLTGLLADNLMNGIVSENPDGPRADGSGNTVITSPDAASLLGTVATGSILQDLNVPDWNFEAASQSVTVSQDSSDQAVGSYSGALNDVLNKYFTQTNLQSIVSNSNADPASLSFVDTQLQNSLHALTGLSVPPSLVDFHKNLIKLLVYEKNTVSLAENASADPVRTSLVLQQENIKYQAAIQSFQDSWQKASTNKAFSFVMPAPQAENKTLGFVNSILGIKTANAQWVVFNPTEFAQLVEQFVQSVLLQILKNTLITQLQNRVLALVRNGGNPKFIQNWSGYLSNTFNAVTGDAIGQVLPGLCPQFNGDVSQWMRNIYPTANIAGGGISLNGGGGTNCTLQTVVNNIPGYYTNFNTGGWNGFGALLQPNNNPYGALLQAHDEIGALASAATQAAQSKAVAASGYIGQDQCPNGAGPQTRNGNFCVGAGGDTEPFNTLPGATMADTVGRNLNSSIDLIVNANDVTGVIATIAGAFMQQVIQSGVGGLLGAANAGTGVAATPPPAPLPLACNPQVQNLPIVVANSPQTFAAFGATGGANAGGVPPTYTWTANGGGAVATPANGTGPGFNVTVTVNAPGTYNITATVTASTGGTATCHAQISAT